MIEIDVSGTYPPICRLSVPEERSQDVPVLIPAAASIQAEVLVRTGRLHQAYSAMSHKCLMTSPFWAEYMWDFFRSEITFKQLYSLLTSLKLSVYQCRTHLPP
ncbi:hypothetical protein RRG08_003657 [Elysia crispata]|uniref:Uncharacterized protein n=1 Tax=Elysia crispata TaxID=231223 RepID=A0AAE1E523_9GAST|nr:hypothetical protein RRG08_003657 [Elysia crispata]